MVTKDEELCTAFLTGFKLILCPAMQTNQDSPLYFPLSFGMAYLFFPVTTT